jgi:hypothetical protein
MTSEGMRKLHERADALLAEGAEPFRVEVIRRARRFKRSWLEMAEALCDLKVRKSYENWGFSDLYSYCAEELLIKRATVDKLTGSYRTIQRYAPELLQGDGDDARVPSFDSVDYFARAVGERGHAPDEPPSHALIDQLKGAVFDEARPVASIRKQFHATLFPKRDEGLLHEHTERTRAQVRRLVDALSTVHGIDDDTLRDATRVLEALERALTLLVESAEGAAARERASA